MSQQKFKALLISDFNLDVLNGYLRNDRNTPAIESTVATPYGQVIAILVDENLECWKSDYNFALVWTQPEHVIESFQNLLNFNPISIDKILAEVDEYAQVLINLQRRINVVFIPTWVLPTYHRGYGMLDMRHEIGLTNILMRMNLRLAEKLHGEKNMYILNTQKWIESVGKNAFNSKLWFMGKIPFENGIFKNAVNDIKAALNGIVGNTKKIIIVDLDETLWSGVVGDVGWENVRLGGHDPIGEALVDFQKSLKSFKNRGILLGIVSKNEEAIALEVFNNHPEMVLKLDDFAGWKINWNDKAQNIVDLVSELNLGLQSVVLIDDNLVERARVREALPEVFVPEWPEDKMLYKKALLSLSCFDVPFIGEEDVKRAEMYEVERKRRHAKVKVGSLDDWLLTLGIKIKVEEINEANLQRTTQLLNKTNQMNLITRRMTETELMQWVKENNRKLWTFRASDKFGDSGLIGLISFELNEQTGWIVDFVLSCRVIGRKIEETMIYTLINYARSIQINRIHARYIPTPKNKPCLQFWKKSGFQYKEKKNLFIWEMNKDYAMPDGLQIESASFESV